MCRHNLIIIVFLLIENIISGQNFKITPNNNQYFMVDYYEENDPESFLKLNFIISVTEEYKSYLINPSFYLDDGKLQLSHKTIMPGKYKIELQIATKKKNSNCISHLELSNARFLSLHLKEFKINVARIKYESGISREFIYKQFRFINEKKSNLEDLISFTYDYNLLLRKYDPFCSFILPEVSSNDFSKKIVKTINAPIKQKEIKTIYSLSQELKNRLIENSNSNRSELINALSSLGLIHPNFYNKYNLINLESFLKYYLFSHTDSTALLDNSLIEIISSFKENNCDSTQRYLTVVYVNKKGIACQGLSIKYSPLLFYDINYKKRSGNYFKCLSSPSYNIFSNANYVVWVENENEEKISKDIVVKTENGQFKELVMPVHYSLAIVQLRQDFLTNPSFDIEEFDNELNRLIIRYRCLFLTNVSISIN